MFTQETIIQALGLTVVGAPLTLVVVLGVPTLLGRPLHERVIGRLVQSAIGIGLLAALVVLGLMLSTGARYLPVRVGNWVLIHDYHFSIKFVFDRLSVPFVILSFLLCGTIGAFGNKYMHRERGFNRFFMFYAVFVLGMIITSLAGTIETLFTGWELVGLSSALLVAFYQERPSPVRNGLHVWCVYRISDAALLIASVVLHHLKGGGDFYALVGTEQWPAGHAEVSSYYALVVGLLLLLAAAGKSALVPFSGWLPRAMEGPTPSSAVFYGALSVHLGAFLLLRISPILDLSPWLGAAVMSVGLLSALFSAYTGRVQTDIKSALSFASLSQVGIIVAEIGFTSLFIYFTKYDSIGYVFRYITLIHILGHGCLRTLQFVRAPTLLHDYRIMENAIGERLPRVSSGFWGRLVADNIQPWLYRLALERGYLDAWLYGYLVHPLLRVFRTCDTLERKWTDLLSGEIAAERKPPEIVPEPLEQLL